MKGLPPREGRKSRLGHISVEDFAALLGTTKQRVIDWRKGKAYPDERNRERLASVSAGRYTADDFKGPSIATRAEMEDRLEELETKVADLTTGLEAARRAHRELRRQVAALEKALPAAARRRTQPAATTNHRAQSGP